MKKGLSKVIAGLALGASLAYSPIARAETWEINLCNKFVDSTGNELMDNFFPAVDNSASDSYVLGEDTLNPPPVPGDYSELSSVVDGDRLMVDKRAPIPFSSSKTWNLDLILANPSFTPMSGTNNIKPVDISQVPADYLIILKDYGTDSSRMSLVNSVDMRATTNYSFSASGLGIVRYLDLTVTNVPEPSAATLVGFAAWIGYLASRKRK